MSKYSKIPKKLKLISYLKSGISFRFYFGGSPCRFICEKRMVGCEEYTDGLWAWPEGLAHYVEVHNVRLPEERFRWCSRLPKKGLDESFWIEWGKTISGIDQIFLGL